MSNKKRKKSKVVTGISPLDNKNNTNIKKFVSNHRISKDGLKINNPSENCNKNPPESKEDNRVLYPIHQFCKGCCENVKKCDHTKCPLWPLRSGMRPKTARKKGWNVGDKDNISHLQAIRKKWLDLNGSPKEIALDPDVNNPIYPFRFGVMPKTLKKRGKK